MTEADEDTAIANAEAFCRTLEAIARTLPKVALATHPALGTGAVGGAAVAPGDVGDHLRAARAFEAVVAGDTGTDRPATTTWYSAGKRHLHQPQLESLAELIAPLMTSTSKTAMKEQTTFRDDADADARGGAGRGRRAVLELGAGRALLGRIVSKLTGAPLIAVDRRVAKDARDFHDEWDEADGMNAKTDGDVNTPQTDWDERVVVSTSGPSRAPGTHAGIHGPDRRLVADLTRCGYADLAKSAGLRDFGANEAMIVAKHLCAGATDAGVRLAIEGSVCSNDKVVGVALAPCCHPQIAYGEYSGREWLERRWAGCSGTGAGLGPEGFGSLLALLALAKERVGTSEETLMRYHGKALGDLAAAGGGLRRLRRLGRAARRVIEQGRAEALRAGGFADARVCRYVDASVSPDNLVIVAGGGSTTADGDEEKPAGPKEEEPPGPTAGFLPSRGVVVKANAAGSGPHGSLAHRLAEYILEHRGCSLRRDGGDGTSEFDFVFTATNEGAETRSTADDETPVVGGKRRRDGDDVRARPGDATPAVVVVGDPAKILRAFALTSNGAPAFFAQSLGHICPFDRRTRMAPGESSTAALTRLAREVEAEAMESVRGNDRVVTVRLSAWPRALEAALVTALQSSDSVRLHPTEFDRTVNMALWTPHGDDDEWDELDGVGDTSTLLWSIMRREAWDPRGWRQRVNEGAPTAADASKAERSLATWLGECEVRLPDVLGDVGNPALGLRVLIVTDSNKAVEDALVRWASGVRAATRVDVARPRMGGDGWSAEIVRTEWLWREYATMHSRVRARACACFASSGISRMSSARSAPGSSREGRGMRREGDPPKRWRPGLGCWGRYDWVAGAGIGARTSARPGCSGPRVSRRRGCYTCCPIASTKGRWRVDGGLIRLDSRVNIFHARGFTRLRHPHRRLRSHRRRRRRSER